MSLFILAVAAWFATSLAIRHCSLTQPSSDGAVECCTVIAVVIAGFALAAVRQRGRVAIACRIFMLGAIFASLIILLGSGHIPLDPWTGTTMILCVASWQAALASVLAQLIRIHDDADL